MLEKHSAPCQDFEVTPDLFESFMPKHFSNKGVSILIRLRSLSLVTFFAYASVQARPSTQESFMPDNDLWMDDSIEAVSNISEAQFNKIIDVAVKSYDPVAHANRERLTIQRMWNDSTVNATMRRDKNSMNIYIHLFGGLARRPEVTIEGFALVLCHEFGHAYGGQPFIDPNLEIAAEGIADYYGASTCFNNILDAIPSSIDVNNEAGYIAAKCRNLYASDGNRYNHCVRGLNAGISLGRLLSSSNKEKEPNYQTPDKSVVKTTEISYPKTIQCRVDTYHNALLGLIKPACWFSPVPN